LCSRLIEFFEVDFEDKFLETMKPNSEVNHTMLHKIGLMKSSNGTWLCKADRDSIERAGASGTAGEEAIVVEYAMVPYNPPMYHGEPLSRFEQMVLGRLDNIVREQRMHHE